MSLESVSVELEYLYACITIELSVSLNLRGTPSHFMYKPVFAQYVKS